MKINDDKKIVIFVSTGRCGTKRLYEILSEHLPDDYAVVHQTFLSRLSNILGNIMFYTGSWEWLREKLYLAIIKKYAYKKHFVITDPLTSMVIPKSIVNRNNTYIVHIERNADDFAESFFNFSRKRVFSFIAHNFIPFWQLSVWPLENILNSDIKEKYIKISSLKNIYFKKMFYMQKKYNLIYFENLFLEETFVFFYEKIFNFEMNINKKELLLKSNETEN